MFGRPLRLAAGLSAALLAMLPGAAIAAAARATGSATVDLLSPLTIQKLQDLDFGTVAVTTAGTAVVDPVANSVSTTGGLVAAGGTPHAALFRGAASQNSVVNIKLPKQPITLTRVGGTQTVTVSNFTLDGPTKRQMGQATTFDIRVGATLTVPAGQTAGQYIGTFDVTAQYP
jgi:hypothetical protein